ncbi:hypothetical protein [Haloprofundus salilacus]|uniref:hypothetical protein n=1 Tax=Haloprofundus salilacus TaxID=2876190 RepID=UPI001CCB48F3|nr:hypothetical protein [Haloprofundus salilacus]
MRGRITVALAALLLLLVGGFAIGGVAAEVTELHNETHAVNNDTTEMYIDVMNTTYDDNGTAVTGDVTVTYTGIDANGTETELGTSTVSAGENDTVTDTLAVDGSAYEEVRITVDGESAELIESGVIGRMGTGGGFLPEGDFAGIPYWFIGVLALIGGWFYLDE